MFCSYYSSPLGLMAIQANDNGLKSVDFIEESTMTANTVPNSICEQAYLQLREYFAGSRKTFDLPLSLDGTTFQQSVWQQLLLIPYGKTTTYSNIAGLLNNPLSVRAVGTANGSNPLAIIVPCHRVIGASGQLTGYAGGLWRKEKLLLLEGYLIPQVSLF